MPRPFRSLFLLGTVSLVVTAGCVGVGLLVHGPEEQAAPTATPLATSLSSVDTTALVVRREPFCDRLDPADVAAALGSAPTSSSTWTAGQQTAVAGGRDVADEDGCHWSGRGRAFAEAWIFAPPVTRAWAHELDQRPDGCSAVEAPAYGRPGSAYTCEGAVTFQGLFGDAWLTCRLHTDDVALAGRWCLAVARAAD